ncbi:hypothetical protein GN244_ATG08311 [Phytophthora infestans]|uniref:Uncharacterized protein n=1 Tax=Phytophthora infestans TaxID=4787 RepID=A0A833T4R5_PHYIN|nr:hypothetical protein GN244_ATG08311 [Phytophthora infestans]
MLDESAETSASQGLCLKPLCKSSSPDGIFVAQRNGAFVSEPKAKKHCGESTVQKLFLGLAVKKCSKTSIGIRDIVQECEKFEIKQWKTSLRNTALRERHLYRRSKLVASERD